VSFPSSPPPGHESVPPPLGFAPPELSAWKGLTNAPLPREAASSLQHAAAPDVDVETTFVSEPVEHGAEVSSSTLPVETISLNSIPEPAPPRPPAQSDPSIDFDDEPQRPTLVDFPPPAAPVDVRAMIAGLTSMTTRDAIVELTFRCMSHFANRVALFSAKRDGFYGWLCNEAFGAPETLRKVFIPNDQPSIMATAATTSIYLGPIPQTPIHNGLRTVMGRSTGDVAVASVRVGAKVAAMLVCDELRDTLSGTRRLDELARAMGDALTRLVKTRG
ncbi:MAG TPA: hypothetical protein PKA58_35695, partial [Polyangium sp.]|nr:hypothetical protein [Polyangium sp.]